MKEHIAELQGKISSLKTALGESDKKCHNMEIERNAERNKCTNLTDELNNTLNLHEKEVVMRLKFEAKINEMQAV